MLEADASAVVLVNAPQAPYADVVVVAHHVLWLIQAKDAEKAKVQFDKVTKRANPDQPSVTEYHTALATPGMQLAATCGDPVEVPANVTPRDPLFILVCKSFPRVKTTIAPWSTGLAKSQVQIIVTECVESSRPAPKALVGTIAPKNKPMKATFSLYPFSCPNRLAASLLERSVSVPRPAVRAKAKRNAVAARAGKKLLAPPDTNEKNRDAFGDVGPLVLRSSCFFRCVFCVPLRLFCRPMGLPDTRAKIVQKRQHPNAIHHEPLASPRSLVPCVDVLVRCHAMWAVRPARHSPEVKLAPVPASAGVVIVVPLKSAYPSAPAEGSASCCHRATVGCKLRRPNSPFSRPFGIWNFRRVCAEPHICIFTASSLLAS